ncbi:FecR domain-containing protein [Pedobacter sp. KR3-3]|uniref:FecR domain-containing protein n=1 Tax=Pedobacter albus TaxID=3113905 RepID=A0ABU7I5N9_9SPHI|nr:FecR domain-containing protein [Pedobacter sp. KR3-3]MEE1944753.1 FecR domain-containing protein [Pedobacter sp. KR3-3]
MTWNATITDDLLVKYLLDEATVAEWEEVEQWLAADARNQKYLDDFKLIIQKSQMPAANDEKDDAALARLHARMEREKAEVPARPLFTRTRAIAAVLMIAVGSWLAYTLLSQNKPISLQSEANVLTQNLPDGSTVILNKHSSFTYPAKFNGDTRTVKLNGEAFFEVAANQQKPFIIEANGVTVQVVGTSFNVKSSQGQTQVIVETGVVKVSKLDKSITLLPGEKVDVASNSDVLAKETNRGKLYNYYYSSELICDKTPLHELVQVLNQKFDTNIVISNPKLEDLPISTTFNNDSLNEILTVIHETFKVGVEYKGNQILLK